MATFYVGQRVRLARPDQGSLERGLVAGVEGVIVERGRVIDWGVRFEGFSNPFRGGQNIFPMEACELEPIINPGLEACDEDFKRDLDKLLERQGVAA